MESTSDLKDDHGQTCGPWPRSIPCPFGAGGQTRLVGSGANCSIGAAAFQHGLGVMWGIPDAGRP